MPHVILGLITLPIQVKSTKYECCHIKNRLATNELLLYILHIWHFLFSCTETAYEICLPLSSIIICNVRTQNEWSYYYLHADVTCLSACGPPVTLPCHTMHADSLLFGLFHHLFTFDTDILLGNFPSSLNLGLPTFHVPSGLCEIIFFSHSYLIHSDHMTQSLQTPLKKLQEIFIVHPAS